MYQRLLSIGQVAPLSLTPLQPSFLYWYKPNQTCKCHASITGHNIDGCVAFNKRSFNPSRPGGLPLMNPRI